MGPPSITDIVMIVAVAVAAIIVVVVVGGAFCYELLPYRFDIPQNTHPLFVWNGCSRLVTVYE